MTDRISAGQAALAAIYASPFMSLALLVVTYPASAFTLQRFPVVAWVGQALLFWFPAIAANVIARGLVAWLGGRLTPMSRHLAIGLIGGALFIFFCDLVSRAFRSMGGGPISMRYFIALLLAALCNAVMIWAVWRFGWKSGLD
jgi:hypothetical protein